MKRRNFMKLLGGIIGGVIAGTALAKQDTRPSMNKELAKMCSDGKYTAYIVATPEQIKQLKADKRSWREVSRVVFEQYAKERRGL